MKSKYDVIVIGGGSPGRHAASALAEGGLGVAVVEREGGIAVPGVDLLRGTGRLAGPCAVEVDGVPYWGEHVVLATGADPVMPPIRGLRGLEGVWTSRDAMEPVPRRLLVLGGGRVGVELAQAARRLGGDVVLIERAGRVLPDEAERLGEALGAVLRRDGIELVLGEAAGAVRRDGGFVVELGDGRELRGDRLLVAAGRRPRVDGIGLESLRMVPNARGIPVDAQMRAAKRVWAIGAVTGLWPQPHVGRYQAGIAAANILGGAREANYEAVPRVTLTAPQAAAVGVTEDTFSATRADAGGYVTLLSDGERLTGAHGLGSGWLEPATLAIRARVPLAVMLDTIQPFSETYVGALGALRAGMVAEVAS